MTSLVPLVALDVSSLSLTKSYSVTPQPAKLVAACLLYGAVPLAMLYALRQRGIGDNNMMWNVASTLIVYAVAVMYFGERLTTYKCMGVAMSLGGLAILSTGSEK